MFCVYCGTKLPDEARFCFMCGKKAEPADNAENIVAANSGSIDEEGFGIEIQEAPTTELHPNSWTGADALISAMSRCEIKSLARSPEWYALFGATFL